MTDRRPRRIGRLIANVAILLGGALLLYPAVGATLDLTIGRRTPALAAYWSGPAAQVAEAEARLNGRAADSAAVSAAALDVWQREPLAIGALRLLAATAPARGQPEQTDEIYRHIETLTRRDNQTELWLVYGAVASNDVEGILRHADRALRASIRSRDYLFQLLAVSSRQSARMRAGIARLIATRPNYWSDLYQSLLDSPVAATIIPDLLAGANLRLEVPAERAMAQASISRLLQLGKADDAYAGHLRYFPDQRGKLLTNGGFETDPLLGSFDWYLEPNVDLASGGTGRASRGDRALGYRVTGDREQLLALQVLVLPPGGYDLTFQYHVDAGTAPKATLNCVRPGGGGGGDSISLAARQTDDRMTVAFSTLPDCRYYTLMLLAEAGGSGWVDDVAVARRGRADTAR